MINFPITNKNIEFELSYGLYNLYFSGGFSIQNLDLLDIHLFNFVTKDTITLIEKSLKPRDIIKGQRVISCYEFQINEFATYKIEILNPEALLIKRSYDNPFSLLRFFFPNPNVNLETINIFIK